MNDNLECSTSLKPINLISTFSFDRVLSFVKRVLFEKIENFIEYSVVPKNAHVLATKLPFLNPVSSIIEEILLLVE